ncbi:lytic transglycosylase domain-containing protein [Sphingosinithalassobacter sp. LHW66-3]|uniref:lytic transglycosylase domain-containing protein n=1 Tax=Sphingosinithalassobacter sp. LHW66-3 TaxID=3424718 RepID=UPI003D6C02E2
MNVASIGNTADVQSAIALASRRTGVDFNYLLGQAQVESGMRADARARTSSATGLYQFIEQSWLAVVKEHGEKHGLGWASDNIRQSASGRFTVADPATRSAILDLRTNPQVAALMAAEHASDNQAALESSLGRATNGTDLYMAHFLGLGGARSFLGALETNPGRSGASMFPAAARANRNIFYAANGQPKSLSEIYQGFAAKLDRGAAAVGATGLASASPSGAAEVRALANGGAVIPGTRAVAGDTPWVETTLANLNTLRQVDPLRPTPDTARLAYLMLASLGG